MIGRGMSLASTTEQKRKLLEKLCIFIEGATLFNEDDSSIFHISNLNILKDLLNDLNVKAIEEKEK